MLIPPANLVQAVPASELFVVRVGALWGRHLVRKGLGPCTHPAPGRRQSTSGGGGGRPIRSPRWWVGPVWAPCGRLAPRVGLGNYALAWLVGRVDWGAPYARLVRGSGLLGPHGLAWLVGRARGSARVGVHTHGSVPALPGGSGGGLSSVGPVRWGGVVVRWPSGWRVSGQPPSWTARWWARPNKARLARSVGPPWSQCRR